MRRNWRSARGNPLRRPSLGAQGPTSITSMGHTPRALGATSRRRALSQGAPTDAPRRAGLVGARKCVGSHAAARPGGFQRSGIDPGAADFLSVNRDASGSCGGRWAPATVPASASPAARPRRLARAHQLGHQTLCRCRRFSACSMTMLCGRSITASVTSSPRWAGRQCMNSAFGLASVISSSLT